VRGVRAVELAVSQPEEPSTTVGASPDGQPAGQEAERELLENIGRGMAIAADLSRSDLLLVRPVDAGRVEVVAQAQPHSIQSLYDVLLVGQTLNRQEVPEILDAWRRGRKVRVQRDLYSSGAPIVQEVHPIPGPDGRPAALLSIETSLIQLERHRSRHMSFRHAVQWVKGMCIRGELAAAEGLSPFSEWDGVLLVDAQRRITYLSGIANNLYRRLGYMEDLRGRKLSSLNTGDDEMVLAALQSRRPLEREHRESSHIWIRKVLPVWAPRTSRGWIQAVATGLGRPGSVGGVLIMVHDATEERRKKQELEVKTTMIQEVHHRVKNNLQTIAAMLRMQARRSKDDEALVAINEAISRILSVAVIHEFLSHDERQAINIRDVCQRIVNQSRQVTAAPGARLTYAVEGPSIYLPSQQATACALVVNELIQNAVEHGFEKKRHGRILVGLVDGGDQVGVEVLDDGDPLPMEFDLEKPSSLGLQIVRSLVEGDLHGKLKVENRDGQVAATIVFPKVTF
jgi:two-component system, sensor histidine kinase PdtaS